MKSFQQIIKRVVQEQVLPTSNGNSSFQEQLLLDKPAMYFGQISYLEDQVLVRKATNLTAYICALQPLPVTMPDGTILLFKHAS